MIRKIIFFFIVIGVIFSAKAQLSDLHYLPPLKQGFNNDAVQQQAVYLSTPEPTSFRVNIYRGTSNAIYAFYDISNTNPAVLPLGNGDNNITLVTNANTGIILNNSGLRFEAPSGNRFYVNYRGNSSAQAASLTSKGRVAMGTNFKWGGVPNLGSHRSKSNTLGIMATEDDTTINLFGYDPGCEFRVGNDRAGITANTHQITLQANESFVYETYIGTAPTQAHEDGWIGASIVSNKNIVISNGSMNFGRQVGATNRDAGIDQPVPEDRLGKEYVFVRGKGNTNGWTEFPLIIAIADNTQIRINGSATPIATINNGDYFQVPSNLYSTNTVGANMHILTSKNVYAYQCLAGSTQAYTTGLNFVAPVNCLLPDVMDNIPDIRNMAGTLVTGGLTIIASVSTPDANITVTDGNGPVDLSDPSVIGFTDVIGPTAIPEWKTMFIPNLTGNVSVQSTGPMAIGFFGFNGAKGVAGYFSGFDTVPSVDLEIRGGTGCFVGSSIFEATGNFDAYQWYDEDGPIPGANEPGYAPMVAGDYYVQGTKGPCTYDSETVQALYCDPDVIVNKTVDKPEIMEGETATFTIRVRNLGVGPLTNLQITDNIPAGLTLTTAFTITGSWTGNTWNIGTLDGGDTAILELEVQADEIDTLPLLSLINTATNSQDQTDTNTTQDNPSARIVVHNDYDNDGVRDITDLDDDNDGVYDEDECETLSFNISNGSPHNSSLISVENYLILDIFSLDNSFNLQINGTDIAGEIQFQAAPGNFARFFDGFGYGENGNSQIYALTGSDGTPLLRVVIDQMGQFQLYGAKSSNGLLEPMVLTTPPALFSWDPSGNNTISVNQDVVGPTNMSGILLTAGCDTDSDGIPDQLDLDSDGDGCSDANEFYKEETADGGDGGEYGTGVPIVDSADGTVNDASYIKVYAPEILLGNTSTDLSGIDINGQDLSLGRTFNYVLTFQNTGDDNATNYTIRDVLPNNITVDNIDTSEIIGAIVNHDVPNGIITFSIPDSFVQIGDPKYTITITVTIESSCSNFVDACSSELENSAFSTYEGILNTNIFTDENGSNSVTACPRTPEVARNSLFNDLALCNEVRNAPLCGENALLTAGQGFTSYEWVLDTNGNGQADASDTQMNDDPDGNPSTLLVNTVGLYIVTKTSTTGCPNQTELINVEGFGTTQTNPIVDYFNQVNNDINPDNDIQGEIRLDCSDGSTQYPDIFLCGITDNALLQMNIPDGDLFWERLDETSCTVEPDGCLTRNLSCTWNQVDTGSNYVADTPGKYRLSITYPGGCFSRFYFNVFQNELDFDVTSSDILCATPGNIRITGVSANYGYQLVLASDNSPIVPFSANNGPNFDIATSETYKVQITPLHPMNGTPEAGTPIAGACIFETEDIGIEEQLFDVSLSSTAADCNALGTISISALNARPNYSYELFADDGSDAGKQLAVNDNTHTFTGVLPGDYTVITSTQDGCTLSRDINVPSIPELTLGAITSENITCTPGIVNLTPGGGLPSPNYEMAIWSKNGTTAYADDSSVPDSEYDTNASFLFGDAGNPNREGIYVFILRDGNGCFVKSDPVTVLDLGTVSISASNSQIVCADSSTASLTVTASGGNAPYHYSLDGGTNYQDNDTFVNLPAGFYTITVMDSSGATGLGCVESIPHEITQPFRLTASATILEDASCNPAGALVKIINANGGQGSYEYSFNGGTFSGVNESNLLPGNHQFTVKDGLGCTFDMELTVPTSASDPSFSNAIDYNCDGEGTITITPSNTTDFTYSYAIDGTPNSPTDNNVFNNQTVGSHDISIGYSSSIPLGQSTLFFENFGAGISTQIAEIGPGYCFEPQDGSEPDCNLGPAGILVNGEYTVTNRVTNPIPSWRSPNEQSGITDGRFLAIDVSSTHAGSESVLWSRENIEVLPNRDITLSFLAYNLKITSSLGTNPEVYVELIDGSGTVISTQNTAEIPKNNDVNDWYSRDVTFNPGANTNVSIVLRSASDSNDGNDLILDDIQAIQQPEVCNKTADFIVVVEDNKEFSASVLGTTDPSCNGGSNGSIRFEVLNFDSAQGFQYSIDGNTPTTSMVSEVTTAAPLTAGSHTVLIEKLPLTTSCSTDFTITLDNPAVIVPSLSQTAEYTCFNTGGTLEASATGGTPSYEYQIEETDGTITRVFQANSTFINIPEGNYLVRVRDDKLCEILLPLADAVTIAPPADVVFDVTPTACYSGTNDGTIVVNVTAGNGNYEFKLGTDPWVTPSSTSPTTYTFTGLSIGSYDIQVRDQLGCPVGSNTQTVTISPQLIVDVVVTPLSACSDGIITVNAIGGNGTLVYSIVPANTPVGTYSTINTLTVTEVMAGDYDVYVQDNNGAPALCSFLQEDITLTAVTALSVNAVPTNPECFDGLGSIDVTVAGGTAPYTYALVDLSLVDGDYSRSNTNISATKLAFNGIGVGDYEITITDTNGCPVTSTTITINNAIKITADYTSIFPANCDDPSNTAADYGFSLDNVLAPAGTIEYSNDGGTSWQLSNELRGTLPGTEVFPSIRVEVSPGVYCQKDFDREIISFPLDNLDIDVVPVVVNCNELRVTVQGTAGNAPYEYAFAEDPTPFDEAALTWFPGTTTHSDGSTVLTGHGRFEWLNLDPGRTYVFYVRDSSGLTGCIRQSDVNVNDLISLPIEITTDITDITPSCDSSANGAITFNINPTNSHPEMRWEIYELGNPTPIEVSGGGVTAVNVIYNNTITSSVPLDEGDYYINITQVDGSGTDACKGASENTYVPELAPLAATADWTRDISCNLPGLITINNITGGGGAPYTYDISGPVGFTTLIGTTDNPVQIPVNSPDGDYTITMYDQYNCTVPLGLAPVTMALTPNPTIALSDIIQNNCAAPISVEVTGMSAAGNLRYALVLAGSPAPTTFEDNAGLFTNITPDTYDIYVIDGNGCIGSYDDYIVQPVLSASAAVTGLLDCTGTGNALINIEILDGSSSYEYSITSIALDGTASGVAPVAQTGVPSTNFIYEAPSAGIYTITIYDTNTPDSPTCNREFTRRIEERIVPLIDTSSLVSTDVTCEGNDDGTITISTLNSSAAPYTFEITSLDGTVLAIPITADTPPGTSAIFTDLAPTNTTPTGGYIVTITSLSNDCYVVSTLIKIDEPDAITYLDAPATTVTPFGCSSDNTANNAVISIDPTRVDGGSDTYTRYEFIDVVTGNLLPNDDSPNYIYTNKLGGDVRVVIYDDNGCSGEITVTIPEFDQMHTPTISVVNAINCNVGEDIDIDVVGSITNYLTNPGNYEFRMLPATTYQATGSFPGLQPDTYTFGVRNITTNCEMLVEHIVEEPNIIEFSVQKLNDVVCFGTDGRIQLLITDATYVGDYTWTIYDPLTTPTDRLDDTVVLTMTPGADPRAPIDLPGGDYLVEITQDGLPNCNQFRAFSIAAPSIDVGLNTIAIEHAGCTNNQGSATITPFGGLAPYDITITNTTTSITYPTEYDVYAHTFTGLPSGQYSVAITDALTCTRPFANAFEILLPDPIDGLLSATSLQCAGDTNAQVEFTLSTAPPRNVAANYTYTLNRYSDISKTTLLSSSAPQTSEIFNNQGAGFYTILVEDNINGCPYEDTTPVEIVDPTEVSGTIAITQSLSCLVDAELELTVTGGTGTYEWSTDGLNFNPMNGINGPNTHVFQNVTVGTYQYFIQDSNHCDALFPTNEIPINAIVSLTAEPVNADIIPSINCNGEATAVIDWIADGGLGDYEYALYGDQALTNEIRTFQASGTFADLPAGSYYIHVRSGIDCLFTSEEIFIEDPEELIVLPIITDISCNGENDGKIEFDIQGGSGDYQFAISPNLNQFHDDNGFEGLAPGDYTVIVQDSKGCFVLIEFLLEDPEVLTMVLSATPEICEGDQDGTISVTIDGGTPPYSTAINSDEDVDFVEGRLTFPNLEGGDYFIYVKDANGCPRQDLIRVESGANLNATLEVVYECTGDTPDNSLNIVFEDQSVAPDVLYALDSTDPNDLALELNFENLAPGDHYIYLMHANGCPKTINFEVEAFDRLELTLEQLSLNEITANAIGGKEGYTYYFNNENNGDDNTFYIKRTDTYSVRVVDENGCESTASIYIEFIDIEIPNFFTPDGDGQNDTWVPRNITQFPDIFIKIYDRYGREVYRIRDNEDGWDGLYQEADLPTGDYWYVIKLNGEDDQREFVGNFTLYR